MWPNEALEPELSLSRWAASGHRASTMTETLFLLLLITAMRPQRRVFEKRKGVKGNSKKSK